MQVQLAPRNQKGLMLPNPVMVASGTFGYGMEYGELVGVQKLGAVVSKGTTLKPREGNPQPRLIETPAGLLNSVGLENIGVEALIREIAPIWATWQVPVVVNIAGESVGEYAAVAESLDSIPGVSGIEMNISCPNVAAGGMEFGTDPDLAAEVTRAVRKSSSLPLLLKLTPNITDIVAIAKSVVAAGADALTVCNTLRGMAIDVSRFRPSLGNVFGGLSGPAIKPVALYLVYKVSGAVDVPVIGCGGISSSDDALEFIMAGASAVQVGTAIFQNPRAPVELIEGLQGFMEENEIEDLGQIVGQVLHSMPK